jgi:hypothetical protein
VSTLANAVFLLGSRDLDLLIDLAISFVFEFAMSSLFPLKVRQSVQAGSVGCVRRALAA